MADYIEREAAIAAIQAFKGYFQDSQATDNLILKMEAENIIADLDSADVAPVRHGEWIPISDGDAAECSECGQYFDVSYNAGMAGFRMFKKFYKHCPNCGARMDLGGDGNA